MTIYDRARLLAAQLRITEREALAELGRRGAEKRRRKNHGRVTVPADRSAFTAVESPRYWYMDRD